MTSEAVDKCSAALGYARAQELTELFWHACRDLSRIADFAKVVAGYYATADNQQRSQDTLFAQWDIKPRVMLQLGGC
jgi:hypothetical protein